MEAIRKLGMLPTQYSDVAGNHSFTMFGALRYKNEVQVPAYTNAQGLVFQVSGTPTLFSWISFRTAHCRKCKRMVWWHYWRKEYDAMGSRLAAKLVKQGK